MRARALAYWKCCASNIEESNQFQWIESWIACAYWMCKMCCVCVCIVCVLYINFDGRSTQSNDKYHIHTTLCNIDENEIQVKFSNYCSHRSLLLPISIHIIVMHLNSLVVFYFLIDMTLTQSIFENVYPKKTYSVHRYSSVRAC